MNKENRSILIGMVLGDGYIYCKDNIARLRMNHSLKQYEYINHKAILLGEIFNIKKPKLIRTISNGYPQVILVKEDKYFRILRKWIYKNNIKTYSKKILDYLTPHGIAIWWMDDGSLSMKMRDNKIHAREGHLNIYITKSQNEIISNWFFEKYNISFVPVKNKGLYRLRINTTNLKRFLPIIKPYIIDSMKYKIDMQYYKNGTSILDDDIVQAI